ncbi:MAG: hypothetical protein IPI28_03355 [Candidatus Omnitrophica bacterium]|nr:hypothetical protein [Candidatus Omnitrophota bacterium]
MRCNCLRQIVARTSQCTGRRQSLNTEPIDSQPILVADSTETPRAGERVSLEGIRALLLSSRMRLFQRRTLSQVVKETG